MKPPTTTTRLFVLHALVVTAVLAGLFLFQHGPVAEGGPVSLKEVAPPVCLALLAWTCAGVAHRTGLLDGEEAARPPRATSGTYTRSARAARGGSPRSPISSAAGRAEDDPAQPATAPRAASQQPTRPSRS